MSHVVIAGASGFMGRALQQRWQSAGRDVRTIGRSNADATWGDRDALLQVIDGADVLVNLAGRTVNCRYNDERRAEVLNSRVDTTNELNEIIRQVAAPPPLWCNASTATIYSHAETTPHTEADPIRPTEFSEDVAVAWEQALFANDLPNTRRVAIRTAIALGDGDATKIFFLLARLGVGGSQHDGRWFPHDRYRPVGMDPDNPDADRPSRGHQTRGRQRFSWIHINDVLRALEFIEAHDELDGPVNFTTPNPVTNRTLMAALRRTVGMPIGIPAARWMLEPAMWALRTESELILKSRWVLPAKLQDAGFEWEFPDLEWALRDIWRDMRSRAA